VPEIQVPVACHHAPEQAVQHARGADIACAANRLAHRYGFGCEPDSTEPLGDPAFGRLGLDAAFLASVDGHAPGLFQVTRNMAA